MCKANFYNIYLTHNNRKYSLVITRIQILKNLSGQGFTQNHFPNKLIYHCFQIQNNNYSAFYNIFYYTPVRWDEAIILAYNTHYTVTVCPYSTSFKIIMTTNCYVSITEE